MAAQLDVLKTANAERLPSVTVPTTSAMLIGTVDQSGVFSYPQILNITFLLVHIAPCEERVRLILAEEASSGLYEGRRT